MRDTSHYEGSEPIRGNGKTARETPRELASIDEIAQEVGGRWEKGPKGLIAYQGILFTRDPALCPVMQTCVSVEWLIEDSRSTTELRKQFLAGLPEE